MISVDPWNHEMWCVAGGHFTTSRFGALELRALELVNLRCVLLQSSMSCTRKVQHAVTGYVTLLHG
jgi:hypothetical protein